MPNDKDFELDDLEAFSFDDLSLDEETPAAETGEDPFGVWVKSAPEDVAPGGAEDLTAEAAGLPPLSDDLPEEDFLSTEELADLDESFDFVTVDEPLPGEEAPTDADPIKDEVAFLDAPEALDAEQSAPAFDEVSLDDFVSFDEVPLEDLPAPGPGPLRGNDLEPSDDDELEEFLDIDIDIEDDINDEELEIVEGARPASSVDTEEVSLDDFAAQEVDLSEFGDFEDLAGEETVIADGEDLPEVKDIPEIPSFEKDIAFSRDHVPSIDEGFFEEEVLDHPLPEIQALEPDDKTDMDHIMALEEDLTSGIRESTPLATSAAPVQVPDLAAQILEKIEQELSGIKQELSDLKKEMTHLRAVPNEQPEVPKLSEASETAEVAETPHGFFDDEDDETIALTGDELDNLLSTAEISEGEEPGVSLDDDLLSLDAEGNLIVPEPLADSEPVHVTDEEFLSGTSLDLNDPEEEEERAPVLDENFEIPQGVPESIELEEALPPTLDDFETDDLLEPSTEGSNDFDLGELDIPFDDEVGLEPDEVAPLAPELPPDNLGALETEGLAGSIDEMPLDDLPPLMEAEEFAAPQDVDAEGWSLPVEEILSEEPVAEPVAPSTPEVHLPPPVPVASIEGEAISPGLKDELRAVLSYMDKLLASLPDDKIQEFAESEHFEVYKRLFEELGLIE